MGLREKASGLVKIARKGPTISSDWEQELVIIRSRTKTSATTPSLGANQGQEPEPEHALFMEQAHRVTDAPVAPARVNLDSPAFVRRNVLVGDPKPKRKTAARRPATPSVATAAATAPARKAAVKPAVKAATAPARIVSAPVPNLDNGFRPIGNDTNVALRRTRRSYDKYWKSPTPPQDTDDRDKGHSHVVPATMITGGLLAVAFAVSQLGGGRVPVAAATGTPDNPTGAPIVPAKKTDAPTAVITKAPITPEPTATPAPTKEAAPTLINITDLEAFDPGVTDPTQIAADLFGVPGTETASKDVWEINIYGQAHLKVRPDDAKVFRIRTGNAKSGLIGVIDGWVNVAQQDGRIDSENIVSIADEQDVSGATVWVFTDRMQGFAHVAAQQEATEVVKQPGTLQNCVYPVEEPTEYLDTSHLIKIADLVPDQDPRKTAAAMFGADSFSKDWHSWGIDKYGQAYLINTTGKATRVNTGNLKYSPFRATIDGWRVANVGEYTAENRNAIAVVINPNVGTADVTEGTMWLFDKEQEGYRQLLKQMLDKEPTEQPGVLVEPIKQCPPDLSPAPSASPTYEAPLSYVNNDSLALAGDIYVEGDKRNKKSLLRRLYSARSV
jgi:hypothetical protein